MLSTDQISVLQNILDNEEELIIALAEENNIKSDASIGVAHFLLAEALLHKDLKCKAPLIEPNLRRNLGKWST